MNLKLEGSYLLCDFICILFIISILASSKKNSEKIYISNPCFTYNNSLTQNTSLQYNFCITKFTNYMRIFDDIKLKFCPMTNEKIACNV